MEKDTVIDDYQKQIFEFEAREQEHNGGCSV
jgi:hypothetical protein